MDEYLRPKARGFRVVEKTTSDGQSSIRPTSITVHDDESAVAWYGDGPLLRYDSLEALLARHEITTEDLELEAPASGVLRKSYPPVAVLRRAAR
jgi:hypothetical protein